MRLFKPAVANDRSRGRATTVLPAERRSLSARTADRFGIEFDTPAFAPDELSAGKQVAALGRQHPRDLFDGWQLYKSGGITEGMVECFVVYLAGHHRPIHEVLFARDKDMAAEYDRAFVGMTDAACPLADAARCESTTSA